MFDADFVYRRELIITQQLLFLDGFLNAGHDLLIKSNGVFFIDVDEFHNKSGSKTVKTGGYWFAMYCKLYIFQKLLTNN